MQNYILFFLIIGFTNLFGTAEDHISSIQSSIDNGDYLVANEKFETAITEFDANAALYFIGGTVAVKLDKLDDANKHFIKAIELDNKNEKYRLEQEILSELTNQLTAAKKTLKSGNIDGAIIEFQNIIEFYPNNASVYFNLGQAYKYNKEYDSAYDNFYKAYTFNEFKDDYSKAINEIAQRVAKQGNDKYRLKEYDSAINYFKKAIQYSPNYTKAYFKLALSYYLIGDYENSKGILKKNLAIDPNQAQSEKLLGDIYKKTNNKEKSLENYKKAISIKNDYHQAYYSLGEVYFSLAELENSKEALNNAISLNSNYIKAIVTLGAVEQELGNLEIAINNYEKALELDPRLNDVYFRISRLYNTQEKYDDAKIAAKYSLKIKSQYAPAYFELGIAEMNLCNIVASKDAFEKAKRDINFRKDAGKYLNNMAFYTKQCN